MSCSGTCHLVTGRRQVFWETGPFSNQISTSRRRRSAPLLGRVRARTTRMHTIVASSSLILLQRFDRNFLRGPAEMQPLYISVLQPTRHASLLGDTRILDLVLW